MQEPRVDSVAEMREKEGLLQREMEQSLQLKAAVQQLEAEIGAAADKHQEQAC